MKKCNTVYLFVFIVLFWFSSSTFNPIISVYAEMMGAAGLMIGLIGGAYGFTQMIIRPPLGVLSDKTDRRKIFIILGSACPTAGALMVLLYPSPVTLLLCRALCGFQASVWVLITVLFSSIQGEQNTGRAMGTVVAACTVGKLLAGFLGGLAVQRFGNAAPFYMALVSSVVVCVMAYRLKDVKLNTAKQPVMLKDLFLKTITRNIIIITIVSIVFNYVSSAAGTFTPLVAKALGADGFRLGLINTIFGFAGILGSVFSARITKRLGDRNTLFWSLGLLSVFYCFGIPLAPNLITLYALVSVAGFLLYFLVAVGLAFVIRGVEGKYKSSVMGFYQAAYALGMFVGPVITGALKDSIGINSAFVALGVLTLLCSFYSLTYSPEKDQKKLNI